MSKEDPNEDELRIQCGVLLAWAGGVEQEVRENRDEEVYGWYHPTPQRGRAFLRHTPVEIRSPLLL